MPENELLMTNRIVERIKMLQKARRVLSKLSKDDLIVLCTLAALSMEGNKKGLVERLKNHLERETAGD